MELFDGDANALAAGRLRINEEFRKNKDVSGEEEISNLIANASDNERYLRTMVVQATVHKKEDGSGYDIRPKMTKDTALEINVPYDPSFEPPKRRSRNRKTKCCQE